MLDTKLYQAGETVTATLTLESGHACPTQVWVSLDLQPEFDAAPVRPRANRISDLTLQTARTPQLATGPAAAAGAQPLTMIVQAVVPKYMVGGVYKATNALFFMPDGSQYHVARPDPDGDFRRTIADDPPVAFDTPIIQDLD